MMKLLNTIVSGRNLILLFVLFLLSYLSLNAFHHPASILSIQKMSGGYTILNLLPYYDAELAYEHLMAYTPESVTTYQRVLILDLMLVIPVYVAFFAVGISYFLTKLTRIRQDIVQRIAAIPLAAGLLNLIEDGIIMVLLQDLPHQHTGLAALSGYLTMFKTIIISACLITISVLCLIFIVRTFTGALNSQSI